jgi:dihydroorotate dehydrogenase (NAD+) catalytic subunit
MTRRRAAVEPVVDTSVEVGSIRLPNPVMTAAGTAGHGTELAPYGDLSALGAFVVKSLAAFEWAGNPSPRVAEVTQGMINSVGLQGPGVTAWRADHLPGLRAARARVVTSIWGRSVAEFAAAAEQLAGVGPEVIAIEVNLSCPNLEGRAGIFAHDAQLSGEVIAAVIAAWDRPVWAKISANTDRIVDVASAVAEAGAEALTMINSLLGLVYDPETRRPVLGNGGGGVTGRVVHPVAVRAVHDVHRALPHVPIVGVGGVASGWDAAELMLAGASAVQVGTATFADPRAPWRIQTELRAWAARHRTPVLRELTGAGA